MNSTNELNLLSTYWKSFNFGANRKLCSTTIDSTGTMKWAMIRMMTFVFTVKPINAKGTPMLRANTHRIINKDIF